MADRDNLDLTTSLTWLAHLVERFANIRLAKTSLPDGLSYARANLLLAIDNAQRDGTSARMVDIALDLGVTGRTLTTMVDALVRQGFVSREVDAQDRRAFQLRLTNDGAALVEPLRIELAAAASTVMAPLTPQDVATLSRLLNRLIER